jgi:Zn finger protein HypA/HybF involved in hydrogenase expression
MSERVYLACTVCTEEFIVPIEVYEAHSSVVLCPCCGSTDLVLLGVAIAGAGQMKIVA